MAVAPDEVAACLLRQMRTITTVSQEPIRIEVHDNFADGEGLESNKEQDRVLAVLSNVAKQSAEEDDDEEIQNHQKVVAQGENKNQHSLEQKGL